MAAPTVSDPRSSPPPGDPGDSYHLLVMGPEHTAAHRLPDKGSVSIGRAEDADVRIVDPVASRIHARLHIGETLEVEDLGSANGTSLRERPLEAGRRVRIDP